MANYKEDHTGVLEILNGAPMVAALTAKGHEGNEISRGIFDARSKHEDTPPVEYPDSFGVRNARNGDLPSVEVFNDDRTAEWVEFGAHPGGGDTAVLKYRVLGLTLDALEARNG